MLHERLDRLNVIIDRLFVSLSTLVMKINAYVFQEDHLAVIFEVQLG
jgi:hypothetical protein